MPQGAYHEVCQQAGALCRVQAPDRRKAQGEAAQDKEVRTINQSAAVRTVATTGEQQWVI
jgi:hypothetical protein